MPRCLDGSSELQMDLLSSKGWSQGAASNRLSESHTEWLQARIWSEKWRSAEWSWATAESELFDSGSKMSGGSKCTAGGDEERWNHTPVTRVLWTHTVTKCVSSWCPYDPSPRVYHRQEGKAMKLKSLKLPVQSGARTSTAQRFFNFTLSEGEEHRALSSPAPVGSVQLPLQA